MMLESNLRIWQIIPLLIIFCFLGIPAQAKYSGGTGEPNDPYQIATAEDLMLLGETPEDYDKHFIQTADINLDPNLPGRKVFDRAVIAPDVNDTDFYYDFQGIPFSGVFNGNGHTISHLTIDGISNLGLFGQLHEQAAVSNVILVAANVNGVYGVGAIVGDNFGGSISDSSSNGLVNGNWFVGGLMGNNSVGSIINCCSTGVVTGKGDVGGLVGRNGKAEGSDAILTNCYSTATVSGGYSVGGLAGSNYYKGSIAASYSTGEVTGIRDVGGLVGNNLNDVAQSHSTATVSGDETVGGLVGYNARGSIMTSSSRGSVTGNWSVGGLVGWSCNGNITTSYSRGFVTGTWLVGGLVGYNAECSINTSYSSSKVTGYGYIGGLVGYNEDSNITMSYSSGVVTGNEDVGGLVGYNGLSSPGIVSTTCSFWDMESSGQTISAGGEGKTTAEMQMANTFLDAGWDFVDETENGTEYIWKISEGFGYPHLWWELSKYGGGSGDPNDPYLIYTANHLNEMSDEPNDWDKHFKLMADIDLSGYSYDKAVIAPHIGNQDLFKGTPFTGVFDGNGHAVLHLANEGESMVSLFGYLDSGAVVRDLGITDVDITGSPGGLVAENHGYVTNCYSTGTVSGGDWLVSGLVGMNYGTVSHCYSNCEVSGNNFVGGLVGSNYGTVIHCYSNGAVSGSWQVGGLVGFNGGNMTKCFWDMETSGQTTSDGGIGKTTAEMQTAATFLEAGWDFVDETANGTEDIWWILEGQNYPRLSWEAHD